MFEHPLCGGAPDRDGGVSVPPRTWGHYAAFTYQQAQRAGHKVYNRERFEETVALDGIRRLSELAARWWAMFVLDERRLAQALVDGQPPRYVQRRQ